MNFVRKLDKLAFGLCIFGFTFAGAAELDICAFDEQLVDALTECSQTHSGYTAILDFIRQDSLPSNNEICPDEEKSQDISKKVTALFRTSNTGHSTIEYKSTFTIHNRDTVMSVQDAIPYDIAYTKYEHFSGIEENERKLSDEDNAVYNIVLDYIIAKYDKRFANVKHSMISAAMSGDMGKYGYTSKIDALIEDLEISKLSMIEGKSTDGVKKEREDSWAGLWITKNSSKEVKASKYSWLQRPIQNFAQKYPASPYTAAISSMSDEKLIQDLVQAEEEGEIRTYKKDDRRVGFGLGVMVGKTLLGSNMEPMKEKVSVSVPNFRLQIIHVVAQLQGDMYLGGGTSAMGLEGLFGYNLEYKTFGADLLVGIGFDQFFMGEDTTSSRALLAGIQGYKHFYFGVIGAFTPKLQWTLKTLEFDSPITKRKRRVYINQFYFGIALDFLVPLSEI